MKFREFGSTGFEVSALGMGCMRLPTVRYVPQKVDMGRAFSLIRGAVDRGVNYVDTAWPYHMGGSEKVAGMALRDGYREKVHLVTKLFMPMVRKAEDFDRFLDRQLTKLQTDHFDTYLFHGLNRGSFEKVKNLDLVERMIRAREKGKIRFIGFSFHDTLPVFREIIDYYSWDVTQIQYNYMDTAVQATHEGLLYAGSRKIAVVVMEPVRGGQLANPPAEAKAVMARSAVQRSAVDWALQYLWNLPEVSVVLSGMGSMKMLEENCASADRSGIGILGREELQTIQELVRIYSGNMIVPCTACNYCMDCPSGVDIPQNFAILNNVASDNGGWQRWRIKRSYRKLADDPMRLNGNRSTGSATLCTECGDCLSKCPQSINIPEELKKAHQVLGKGKKIREVFPK